MAWEASGAGRALLRSHLDERSASSLHGWAPLTDRQAHGDAFFSAGIAALALSVMPTNCHQSQRIATTSQRIGDAFSSSSSSPSSSASSLLIYPLLSSSILLLTLSMPLISLVALPLRRHPALRLLGDPADAPVRGIIDVCQLVEDFAKFTKKISQNSG